jgi:hypothetical protein
MNLPLKGQEKRYKPFLRYPQWVYPCQVAYPIVTKEERCLTKKGTIKESFVCCN